MYVVVDVEQFGYCPHCSGKVGAIRTASMDESEFWTMVCPSCLLGWEVPSEEVPKSW